MTTPVAPSPSIIRPSREKAMEAVRTLIAWAGDDPARAGLIDTPQRVVDAYGEWFQGYSARSRQGALARLRGRAGLRRHRHAARASRSRATASTTWPRSWARPASAYVPADQRRRHLQAGPASSRSSPSRLQTQETLTQPDRRRDRTESAAGRGRRGGRRRTSVHDHPRRAPSSRHHLNHEIHWRFQSRPDPAGPIPAVGAGRLSAHNDVIRNGKSGLHFTSGDIGANFAPN
jgi:hypothetical protein